MAEDPDRVVDHRPTSCPDCGLALPPDLPAETVSVHEHIELPPVKPVVEQHRRLSVCCPACRARVVAPRRSEAASTPFGPRLHATAVYLKTFQALSYERLQKALSDLFGLTISQGGLMNMLRRAETRFDAGRDAALSALRRAEVVASDETGVRIEGSNSYHWVFRCDEAVVHHAAPTRAASVVHEIMDGHRPAVWLSDRYSAQQGHGERQQTCLAHLARDVAYALDAGDDPVALRLKLWLGSAFALARSITTLAASTIAARRRKLERAIDDILAAPTVCDLARDIQNRMRRARDQLMTFASFPGQVEAHNNACERDLRPAVIQRKNTNGYRPMWSRQGRGRCPHGGGDGTPNRRGDHLQYRARHYRRLSTPHRSTHPVGVYALTSTSTWNREHLKVIAMQIAYSLISDCPKASPQSSRHAATGAGTINFRDLSGISRSPGQSGRAK